MGKRVRVLLEVSVNIERHLLANLTQAIVKRGETLKADEKKPGECVAQMREEIATMKYFQAFSRDDIQHISVRVNKMWTKRDPRKKKMNDAIQSSM